MNPQIKQKTPRSPMYLAFIRKQPCIVCGRPDQIDSHHTESGGIATKGSDFSCVPVCWICHRKLHDSGGKKGNWKDEELAAIVSELQGKFKGVNPKFDLPVN